MDQDDPGEIQALRHEVEQALAALDRVDRQLAALEAELINLGRHRRVIQRERSEILGRLDALRGALPARAAVPVPAPSPRLTRPVWVHASEEQAIAFAAGRSLRRLLGDIK